jgi:hypothetical protein
MRRNSACGRGFEGGVAPLIYEYSNPVLGLDSRIPLKAVPLRALCAVGVSKGALPP